MTTDQGGGGISDTGQYALTMLGKSRVAVHGPS